MNYLMICLFVVLFILMYLIGKYTKKKLKVILCIIIGILTSYAVIFTINMNMVASLRKPIFMYEIKNKCAGACKNYISLGYKVEVKYLDGEIIETTMTMFGKVISAAVV